MEIRGLQKLTLVDYPGEVAATVFLGGCNFRCPYCHNPELVDLERGVETIKEKAFFKFLESRKKLIEGICLTGGEPTIHSELPSFIKKIKGKGFLVKLDTNGSNPKMLKKVIKEKLVDYVAMDVKTSLDSYKRVNAEKFLKQIKESVEILKQGKVDYEFRMTVVPKIVDKKDLKEVGQWLKGAKKIILQQFRPTKTLNSDFEKIQPYSDKELKNLAKELESCIDVVELRI